MESAEEFNCLDQDQQYAAMIMGQFLDDRRAKGQVIQLFSIPRFYIERRYDPETNCIMRYKAFHTHDRLVPNIAVSNSITHSE
ncbi:hypothetical protein AAFN85_03055 [Mucilaginibacter sp. CAU 1740]|uniref:hypothetical protein n=1 Tax=Mucilaginibacter sp. CAU 1740 TaxID=3140365 RepID=UPI00325B1D80